MRITRYVFGFLAAMLVCAPTASGQIATRSFFGVRPTPGFFVDPWGADMSEAGVVIANETSIGEQPVTMFAVRWDAIDRTRRLPLSPGFVESAARAITDNGRTIVGAAKRSDGAWAAVRWVDGGACVELAGTSLPGLQSAAALVSESGRIIAGHAGPDIGGYTGRWFVWEEGKGVRWLFGKENGDPRCRVIAVRDAYGGVIDGALLGFRGESPFRILEGYTTIIRAPERLCRERYRVHEVTCSSLNAMAGVVHEPGMPDRTWLWTENDGLSYIDTDERGNVLVPQVLRYEGEVIMGTLSGPDAWTAAIYGWDKVLRPLRDSFIDGGEGGARLVLMQSVVASSSAGIVGGGPAFCDVDYGVWVYLANQSQPVCADIAGYDGIVNGHDLNFLLLNIGTPHDSCADLNRDGAVNTADITIMLNNIGRTCR